jgi:hypothetical protein
MTDCCIECSISAKAVQSVLKQSLGRGPCHEIFPITDDISHRSLPGRLHGILSVEFPPDLRVTSCRGSIAHLPTSHGIRAEAQDSDEIAHLIQLLDTCHVPLRKPHDHEDIDGSRLSSAPEFFRLSLC